MFEGIVVLFILILIYFLPALVSILREHKNASSLFIVNLLLGWTLLGWVACLAWSFSTNENKEVTN